MRMCTTARRPSLLAIVGLSAIAVALSGCPAKNESAKPSQPPTTDARTIETPAAQPAAKPKPDQQAASQLQSPAKTEPTEEQVAQDVEQAARKPRDLGPPLVDDPGNLQQLYPKTPVWIDKKNKWVVLQGEACSPDCPLEFFATYFTKDYESVVTVNVKPSIVHTGLLLVGAEPGHPARFDPKFSPPTGTEIAIEIRWKDANGKVQSTPAQQWIRDIKTKKAMDANWVFAGSMFVTREETGERHYAADSGELICVLSSPTAMLDLPMHGYGALEARTFEAFKEHLPPKLTPVTLLLKPILPAKPGAKGQAAAKTSAAEQERRADAEQKAADAADAWLALVDRAEFSQAWETAAGLLKDAAERREFVKLVGDTRKPFGKLKSRQLESKQYATSLPGVPDGQYVILHYRTSFANKKSAVETVIPMFDTGKKWRVLRYRVE